MKGAVSRQLLIMLQILLWCNHGLVIISHHIKYRYVLFVALINTIVVLGYKRKQGSKKIYHFFHWKRKSLSSWLYHLHWTITCCIDALSSKCC